MIEGASVVNVGQAVGTTRAAIYTADTNGKGATITLRVGNIHASNAGALTVEIWDDSAGARKNVLKGFSIPIKDGINLGTFDLEPDDAIELTADAASTLEAQAHGLEYT